MFNEKSCKCTPRKRKNKHNSTMKAFFQAIAGQDMSAIFCHFFSRRFFLQDLLKFYFKIDP